MRANEMQVGGGHYKGRATQHWDVVDNNGIGYLEGVATKYICRWREKNGLQDLLKAEHYLVKLLEEIDEHGRRPRGSATTAELIGLRDGYSLDATEYGAVHQILTWSERDQIVAALDDVRDLIMCEKDRPAEASPPSKSAVS